MFDQVNSSICFSLKDVSSEKYANFLIQKRKF
jgi:hypothetical protein